MIVTPRAGAAARMAARAAAITVAAVLALAGCAPAPTADVPRVIVPPAPAGAGAAATGPAQGAADVTPIAPIDRADRLVDVASVNIDSDPDEEQVIAVQRRDDPSAPVRILVADHDMPRSRWARVAWESPTAATLARFFTLSTEDLVGDHGLTIIARGINADGRFTLDAFRRSPLAEGSDLTFRRICSIAADDIVVQQLPRPESYTSGQKNGLSFPILSYTRDRGSTNPADLVRVTWSWKYSDNRYVADPPVKVPGEQASQEQLQQLFADLRPSAFEDFLAGVWLDQVAGAQRQVLEFRPADHRIALGSGDRLELMTWGDTLRALSDRVTIVAENEVVPRNTRTLSVRATGISSLSVTIRRSDTTEVSELTFVRAPEAAGTVAIPTPPRPSGPYQGKDGLSVVFGDRTLQWLEQGSDRTASWVTFLLGGRVVLSARFGDNGEERSWLLDLSEKRDGGATIRTAMLSPVVLSAQGWGEAPGSAIELRQTEPARK